MLYHKHCFNFQIIGRQVHSAADLTNLDDIDFDGFREGEESWFTNLHLPGALETLEQRLEFHRLEAAHLTFWPAIYCATRFYDSRQAAATLCQILCRAPKLTSLTIEFRGDWSQPEDLLYESWLDLTEVYLIDPFGVLRRLAEVKIELPEFDPSCKCGGLCTRSSRRLSDEEEVIDFEKLTKSDVEFTADDQRKFDKHNVTLGRIANDTREYRIWGRHFEEGCETECIPDEAYDDYRKDDEEDEDDLYNSEEDENSPHYVQDEIYRLSHILDRQARKMRRCEVSR